MCRWTRHLSDSFGIAYYLEVFQGHGDQRCRQKLSLLYVLILCWWCHGVNGSLARGTRDLRPAASIWFPMVLGDTAGATCSWISSLDVVRQPLLLAQCVDLDFCLYHVAIQNLVCGRGNVLQTTALLKAVTHHRYIVPNMCSNPSISPSSFPQAFYVILFKWLKLFNSSIVCARLKNVQRTMLLPSHNPPLMSWQLYEGYKTCVVCLYMAVLPNWTSGRIYALCQ